MSRNCSALVRRALWVVAAALWAEEGREALTSWHALNPRADRLLDSLTVVLTIVVALWHLHEHYAKVHSQRAQLHERRLKAVFGAMGTACQEAGIAVPEREEPQPNPCVRLVGEDRKTG